MSIQYTLYSNYYNFVPAKEQQSLSPETFSCLKISPKCICGRGSALDPARGLTALPRLPARLWEGNKMERRRGERRGRKEKREEGKGREGREVSERKNP